MSKIPIDIGGGQTIREATSEDALVILARFKQIKHINLEDEAQRLAMILWQEGYVILEHEEEPLMGAKRFLGIKE
ncbi:MAG: hypothetical protein QQN63_03815 [Nitrosopumilus sp.]